MKTKIYYFSGTGNSLVIARDVAKKLKAELVPIASIINENSIQPDADRIGIVFPVYNHGVPFIIKRFVDKLNNLNNKYVFGICTYGDSPCLSMEYLSNFLQQKGSVLSGGFAVKMPYNYISPTLKIKSFFSSFTLREIPFNKQQQMFKDWENRLEVIYGYIKEYKTGLIETKAESIERLVDKLNLRESLQKAAWLKVAGFRGHTDLSFIESIQLMDYGFKSDEKCISCGGCERICPVNNIKLSKGKPLWQHKCEQCFACLQWCPKAAIQFGEKTTGKKRYYHPDVKISDILNKKIIVFNEEDSR